MAELTIKKEPYKSKLKSVTLELSPEEAVTLRLILRCVGGSSGTTPRKFAESIHNSLNDLSKFDYLEDRIMKGTINFHASSLSEFKEAVNGNG